MFFCQVEESIQTKLCTFILSVRKSAIMDSAEKDELGQGLQLKSINELLGRDGNFYPLKRKTKFKSRASSNTNIPEVAKMRICKLRHRVVVIALNILTN